MEGKNLCSWLQIIGPNGLLLLLLSLLLASCCTSFSPYSLYLMLILVAGTTLAMLLAWPLPTQVDTIFFMIVIFFYSLNLWCRDNIAVYARDYQAKFMLGYCATYIFMQTFMIPGTIFMSLLAGALFGVVRGILLVVFTATSGASSCYFLSKLIGRPLANWLWPEKLRFFQSEVLMLDIFSPT